MAIVDARRMRQGRPPSDASANKGERMGLFRNLWVEHRRAVTARALYRRAFMVAQCCAEIRLERTFDRIDGIPTRWDDARLMEAEVRACDVMRHTSQAPVYA